MKKQRTHYTPEEKFAILRRHLPNKEPISKLCDELGLEPTVFYRQQKEFLRERRILPFSRRNDKPPKKGTGFEQPLAAHQHCYIDLSYINISGEVSAGYRVTDEVDYFRRSGG